MTTIFDARIFLSVLLCFLLFTGCENKTETTPNPDQPTASVSMEIVKDGTVIKALSISMADGSTLIEAMERARTQSQLDFEFTGQAETTFVNSIEGIENQRSNGSNWIYRVNGKLGQTGVGSVTLNDQDKVTWTFGKYDPNGQSP